MDLEDRPTDREPHTHTFGLGRVEGLKNPRQHVLVKPTAAILHCHLDRLGINPLRAYYHLPVIGRPLGHGFEAIQHEV
jgi:hypothetical protein